MSCPACDTRLSPYLLPVHSEPGYLDSLGLIQPGASDKTSPNRVERLAICPACGHRGLVAEWRRSYNQCKLDDWYGDGEEGGGIRPVPTTVST